MTGPHDSILGRRIDRVMETTRTFRPTHYDVATGDVRLNGSIVDVDPQTGRATAIRRITRAGRRPSRVFGDSPFIAVYVGGLTSFHKPKGPAASDR